MTIEIHELDITEGLNRELYNRLVKKCNVLEKKLTIAVKALEKIHKGYSKEYNMAGEVADKTLKQIKEVT